MRPFFSILVDADFGDVCQTIQIRLKNEALSAQGSLQGTYKLSSKSSNGEQNWISDTKAIWANPKKDIWLIGSISKLGGEVAGVYAKRIGRLNF